MFGEKPIYFLKNEKGFFFSSEIQVLQKFLNLSIEMSKLDDIEFLSLGFLRSPKTGFQNVNYLQPASIIKIDNNSLTQKKYWRLPNIKKMI